MATNGYARISGGVKLTDINPNKNTTMWDSVILCPSGSPMNIPICGYKQIALYGDRALISLYFKDSSNNKISDISGYSAGSWTQYISIPSNACYLYVENGSGGTLSLFYSMLA